MGVALRRPRRPGVHWERMRDEIVRLAREVGSALLYITHDQTEAFALAERIAVMRAGRISQLGTPTSVYERPVDLDTARFTGSIGELGGVVEGECGSGNGQPAVTIRSHGWRLAARPRGALAPGQPATVIIRPGAATLRKVDSSVHADGHERNRGQPRWEGLVDHCSFQAGRYECSVDVGRGVILRRVQAPRPVPRGAHVHVTLDPAGCLAFQTAGGSPASDLEPAGEC